MGKTLDVLSSFTAVTGIQNPLQASSVISSCPSCVILSLTKCHGLLNTDSIQLPLEFVCSIWKKTFWLSVNNGEIT